MQKKCTFLGILFLMLISSAFSYRLVKRIKPGINMNTAKSWLALGDSYTIGQSVQEKDRYPVQTAQLLDSAGYQFTDPKIIATTGWTTGDLMEALRVPKAVDPPYDIVTLLIGVNNQYQGRSEAEYREQLSSLIDQAIHLAGDRPSHVVLLSIPDYSVTPFARSADGNFIAGQIDVFNKIAEQGAVSHQIHFINITSQTRLAASDPSLLAHDGLHYSAKEYAIWSKTLAEKIKEILGANH